MRNQAISVQNDYQMLRNAYDQLKLQSDQIKSTFELQIELQKDKQMELETLVLDLQNKQRQLIDKVKNKQEAGGNLTREEIESLEQTVTETQ